jgi:hypothetical protein
MVANAGDVNEGISLDRGGRLFDNWLQEMQSSNPAVQAPSMENPLWLQRDPAIPNVQSVSDSWRCVTCHQWNYRGIDLLKSDPDADNLLARLAIRRASLPDEAAFADYLYNWIKSGGSMRHNYGSVASGLPDPLGDSEIKDLVLFLQQGVIDTSTYIFNIDGTPVVADLQRGKQIYQGQVLTEVNCESCHGPSGESIPTGGTNAVDIFALANNNPWRFLHKMRFSNTGTPMPSLIGIPGNDITHAIDVLGYAQQSFSARQ